MHGAEWHVLPRLQHVRQLPFEGVFVWVQAYYLHVIQTCGARAGAVCQKVASGRQSQDENPHRPGPVLIHHAIAVCARGEQASAAGADAAAAAVAASRGVHVAAAAARSEDRGLVGRAMLDSTRDGRRRGEMHDAADGLRRQDARSQRHGRPDAEKAADDADEGGCRCSSCSPWKNVGR